MNPETGEIKDVKDEQSLVELVSKGWIGWSVDELVTVKRCCFKVKEINIEDQTITLKAISKKMRK